MQPLFYAISTTLILMNSEASIPQLLCAGLILVLWLIKILYIRNKKNKMGNSLIKLVDVPNGSLLANLIISLILIVMLILAYYFTEFSKIQTGINICILTAISVIDMICDEKLFGKFILEKGICFNGELMNWHEIRSYEWVKRRKKSKYSSLEIRKKDIYFKTKYNISDNQKEEINEVLLDRISD